MSPHATTFPEALAALDLMLGWRDEWLPVYTAGDQGERVFFHRCGRPRLLADMVRRCDELRGDELHAGLPEARRFAGAARSTVLWVRVETRDAARRAARLPVLPSMVVREGSSVRRTLMWFLRQPLDYFTVSEQNRRLAYFCGATQRHGEPEHFRLPLPGTCLRVGRSRPVPIVVSRLSGEVFEAGAVTRRLKEPPPRDLWLQNRMGGAR